MNTISEVLDQTFAFEPFFPEQRMLPTEFLVRDLESEIGVFLPPEYRSFVLRYGGTAPSIDKDRTPAVWVDGRKDLIVGRYFLGFFSPKPAPHLQQFDLRRAYQDWKSLIGASFLPIMTGEGDAMFCLKLTGERKGSIWAWLRDPVDINTEWENIQEEWGLYSVAPDVLAFVCLFQEFMRPTQD